MLGEEFENEGRDYWNNWWTGFDWEEAREGVNRESRARILLLGVHRAGKSTLLNRLRGWLLSPLTSAGADAPGKGGRQGRIEDFGLFCLADLPQTAAGDGVGVDISLDGLDLFDLAATADLLVYLLDGATGVRACDYRWIGRLRRVGTPLLVTLNKSDLIGDESADPLPEIEERLATSVLPISALHGTNVMDRLLPRMVDACPSLAVPLGRELRTFRHQAAGRLIRRTALFNGMISLEPVPLLDIPLQMITLVGMVLRIATVYDRPPTDAHRREVVAAMAGGLLGRYATQQAIKLIPFVGWLVSGFIGMSCTWLLGRAAVTYFEAGGDAALNENWARVQAHLRRERLSLWATRRRWSAVSWKRVYHRWRSLPFWTEPERDGDAR
jgi:uncharacterized protein (DUF697 family)